MRIVIAGGRSRTDYLIESLVMSGHEVVAVNNDRAWCEYLSSRHDVPVVCGDATKRYVLDDADIEGFDLISRCPTATRTTWSSARWRSTFSG